MASANEMWRKVEVLGWWYAVNRFLVHLPLTLSHFLLYNRVLIVSKHLSHRDSRKRWNSVELGCYGIIIRMVNGVVACNL
jgi:hypothetical protein